MSKEATPKTYRATADGFDGKRYINAGETFTTTAPKGSWMEPVGEEKAGQKAARVAADPNSRQDPDYDKLDLKALQAIAAEKGVPFEGVSQKDLAAALRAAAVGK
ncbi:hypothetical protein [Novosphingobium soli]|uniref:Rho termination factor n=1 Tax=Novosphingobium soli TaxID=574956 RepID=A0ABV6CXN8_9SPHN